MDRETANLGQGVAEDVTAWHVVLVEQADGLEVGLVLGNQCRLAGKAAEEVAGKEYPALGIEGAEGPWEVGVGGEDELELAILQGQVPIVLVHQPEGHMQVVVPEETLSP